MVLNDKNEEKSQKQGEARTMNFKENVKDMMGLEVDESAGVSGSREVLEDDKVTRSREVLEDDVLTWWNEALASQDSVQASQDSVRTVLELVAGDEEQAVGVAEDKVYVNLEEQEQRDDLEKNVKKEQGNLTYLSLNGDIKEEEQKTLRREDSKTPTGETLLMVEAEAKRNEAEQEQAQKGPIPISDSWDMTTGVTDSQLLAMLASKHCYQCTSTSTLDWTDYEEEEEYNEEDYEEEMGEVVSASLHIPMYSPVRVRTTVQFGCKEELEAPLSPLTLLSRRLAQRLKGGSGCTISPPPTPDLSTLEATWLHAVATQTSCTSSTATLRSPVPPMRQQFSPRASTHFYTAPSTPILVTPVPHRRMEEEEEAQRRREEEARQRTAEEVRTRKLKKVLAKEEKERQAQARRKTERKEAEEVYKLEEQWKSVQCSPCTKCKGKQTKGKGKQKVKKKEVQEEKEEKPVMRNIFFGCFKTPPCMA